MVDLSFSTRFKVSYPPPEMWFGRQYTFLDLAESTAKEMLGKPFVKFTGDGALIFCKQRAVSPLRFVTFAESLAQKVAKVNSRRYPSKELRIEFKCVLDCGDDVFVLPNGDPNGTVVDRAFRISSYLMPNSVAVSSQFYSQVKDKLLHKFVNAGKAYLRGVGDEWQSIYALNSIAGFSTQLNLEQRKREALIDIWEMGVGDRPIWIVSGAIHQRLDAASDSYSMQHGDNNAIVEVVHTLSKAYPDRKIEIINSEEYLRRNGPSLANDIVTIGGPDFNLVSKKMLEKLPLRFVQKRNNKFADSTLIVTDEGKDSKLETGRDDNDRIVSDPAVFAKIKDTFGQGRYLYMVMGNQTQGTYAASLLFGISSQHLLVNHEFLKERGLLVPGKRFALIACADAMQDYVEPISLPSAARLQIVTLTV